jgi:hypothetical protein
VVLLHDPDELQNNGDKISIVPWPAASESLAFLLPGLALPSTEPLP